MAMINEIIDKIKKKMYCDNKVVFSFENRIISLISDNLEIIKYANERLFKHFPINNDFYGQFCEIKVYSYNIEDYYDDLCLILNRNYVWNQSKHMGGYYYNVEDGEYHYAIWTNKGHNNFGEESFGVEKVIKNFLNKEDISLLIFSKSEYYHFYFRCNEQAKSTPMRLIRSLFMYELVSDYSRLTYFHAAVIRYKNKGILICGASGNGKTSTLLNFMKSCDGELIANDKTFLFLGNKNELISYGWPTVVTIGVGSLKQYNNLEKFLFDINDINCSQELYGYKPNKKYISYTEEQLKKLPKEGNKLAMSHVMLANLFDKKILPMTQVDVIVNVNHHWNDEKEEIRQIIDNKRKYIEDNLIENISDQLQWIGREKCLPQNSDKVVDYIERNIPIYNYETDLKKIDMGKLVREVL